MRRTLPLTNADGGKAPRTFTAYAKARRITPDAIGDFVRDFKRPTRGSEPRRLASLADLNRYLESVNACEGARLAGIALWREWEGIAQAGKHSRNQGLSQ